MIGVAIASGADGAAIARGQDLFFGASGSAQCFRCHSGPVLADADGSIGTGTGNQGFDIGIAFRAENADDGCAGGPGDPSLPLPEDFKRFSTPALIGIARTAPFFHDNSAPDLRSAVSHYGSAAFAFSEAGVQMEGFRIALTESEIDDLVAFLEAISVDPSAAPAR
jgi:cytochrome c peroxidase